MSNKPKFCGKCGSALPENAKFCGECGEPVKILSEKVQNEKEGPVDESKQSRGVKDFYNRNKKVILSLASILLVFLLFGEGLLRLSFHAFGTLLPFLVLGGVGYVIYRFVNNRRNTKNK